MKIGIFAPSSACAPERYLRSLEQAASLGHEIVQAQNPAANYGSKQFLFSSDSTESRLKAFETLLEDKGVELILAARGGYGCIDLLSGLTAVKARISQNPLERRVVLSGISDVTAILLALDGSPNLELVHGPGFLDAFYSYHQSGARKFSTEKLLEIQSGNWRGYQDLSLIDISSSDSARQLSVRGRCLGGNLSVLASLVGTPYLPDFSNRILFLEEISEKPYRIHRALSQLKFAGLLDNLRAVLLGSFDGCVHEAGLGAPIEDVFKDIFSDTSYPVYRGFPAGHGELNLPLPLGVEVELSKSGVIPVAG